MDSVVKIQLKTEIETSNIPNLNFENFNSICRICLSGDYLSPIVSTRLNEDIMVSDAIKELSKIQVLENELLPQNICKLCEIKLESFFVFKKQIVENDSLLKEVLNKYELHDVKTETIIIKITSDDMDLGHSSDQGDTNEEIYDSISEDIVIEPKHEWPNSPEIHMYKDEVESLKSSDGNLKRVGVHKDKKPPQCEICHRTYNHRCNLRRHMALHIIGKQHVCTICGKEFTRKEGLQNHNQKIHGAGGAAEGDEGATGRNRGAAGGGRCNSLYECEICGRHFQRIIPYNLHLKMHKSGRHFIRDMDPSNEIKQHVCKICNKGYRTSTILKTHLRTHGEKKFHCNECGKGFRLKTGLECHLRVHTGEKVHTCAVCKKSFAFLASFKSHTLTHTGIKPYKCSMCPKAFTQVTHLKYHLRTHTGERPYACTFCGRSFALNCNLTVHMRTHTNETPYICTICGKGFYDSSSMKRHKNSLHKEDTLEDPKVKTDQDLSGEEDLK